MWKEFKEFAMKGNVLDLAIGVIIGAAFGNIVSSLVDNVIMPLIGILLKGVDFSSLAIKVGSAELQYGMFIQSILDFLIIAFSIFLFVRLIMKFKKEEEEEEPEVDAQEQLLTEIRDLLKAQQK
ncbi:large conductance mechanosensitive channel protein MscL [Cerasibacillus terrae]|uniref:Large-conductance mechanosensitive channel n=1 Tax=Cerasibacillus terrae TaxID=2498845 RepID=A0A5C8NTN0_9BACI|nr:large conductance mechanosensitive channel protein MscL [Cerasibacillus terrae]TXL64532.1 large conductance mechanosensitive channel protein MscL [Cerasibacillus terrae]